LIRLTRLKLPDETYPENAHLRLQRNYVVAIKLSMGLCPTSLTLYLTAGTIVLLGRALSDAGVLAPIASRYEIMCPAFG